MELCCGQGAKAQRHAVCTACTERLCRAHVARHLTSTCSSCKQTGRTRVQEVCDRQCCRTRDASPAVHEHRATCSQHTRVEFKQWRARLHAPPRRALRRSEKTCPPEHPKQGCTASALLWSADAWPCKSGPDTAPLPHPQRTRGGSPTRRRWRTALHMLCDKAADRAKVAAQVCARLVLLVHDKPVHARRQLVRDLRCVHHSLHVQPGEPRGAPGDVYRADV